MRMKKVNSKLIKHGELWINPMYSFNEKTFTIERKKKRRK